MQQTAAQTAKETIGTPRLSVLARIEGAEPSNANAYKVLDAIYRSEFEAEITNNKMHPFRNPGRTEVLTRNLATLYLRFEHF